MPATSVWSEFREFIAKGNAIDLAVGVIIGAAFNGVVTSITDGILQPLIALAAPDPSVGLMLGPLNIGRVISALINFLLTAAVVFFAIVKPMNVLRRRLEKAKSTETST
ncbi:MAG: MscL family protein [Chlorobi bacterium]|nr:MscL family protein [Chlorobiota bacterium]